MGGTIPWAGNMDSTEDSELQPSIPSVSRVGMQAPAAAPSPPRWDHIFKPEQNEPLLSCSCHGIFNPNTEKSTSFLRDSSRIFYT